MDRASSGRSGDGKPVAGNGRVPPALVNRSGRRLFLQDFVSAGITPYFLLLPHHLDFFMVLSPFFPAAAFPTAT